MEFSGPAYFIIPYSSETACYVAKNTNFPSFSPIFQEQFVQNKKLREKT